MPYYFSFPFTFNCMQFNFELSEKKGTAKISNKCDGFKMVPSRFTLRLNADSLCFA